MIALVADTPPPAIIECRERARVSSVQHRVWVALGCSGSCEKQLDKASVFSANARTKLLQY